MPNAAERAKRYEERAAECLRLATLATSADAGREYEHIADAYLTLADAELALAAQWAARDRARTSPDSSQKASWAPTIRRDRKKSPALLRGGV